MVCQNLAQHDVPFVAIERDREALEGCIERGWPFIEGDATEDRVLKEAGVDRAAGLAAVLNSDADNLYVVMSAKLIRKDIRVIARAYDDRSSEKLQRAGADHVVSLYASGAFRMAQLLTHPHLGDFFEIVSDGGVIMDLAEFTVSGDEPYAGKTLADAGFREIGLIIVGIRQANGNVVMPPTGETRISAGDRLFAMGNADAIRHVADTEKI